LNSYLALFLGLACAGAGGELFVRGTVGLALVARVSPAIVAATVAAFATSSPEFTVGLSSALAGAAEISLGDVLGSNVFNVAFILALALLMAPIKAPRDSIRRDFPVALLVPVLFAVLLYDGRLSQFKGGFLIAVFFAWLAAVLYEARRQRAAAPKILAETRPWRAVVDSLIGFAFLVGAGKLIVLGATAIAKSYGVSEFIIGATIVAIGTSIPELATTIVSQVRGQNEVGLGTILGSNIFNGLWVVGVASSITPINVSLSSAAPALIFGFAAVALTYPSRSGFIPRWRGAALLIIYAAYVYATLEMN
jgi:cation:H+ antiporter